jgi:hypothetical protein
MAGTDDAAAHDVACRAFVDETGLLATSHSQRRRSRGAGGLRGTAGKALASAELVS